MLSKPFIAALIGCLCVVSTSHVAGAPRNLAGSRVKTVSSVTYATFTVRQPVIVSDQISTSESSTSEMNLDNGTMSQTGDDALQAKSSPVQIHETTQAQTGSGLSRRPRITVFVNN